MKPLKGILKTPRVRFAEEEQDVPVSSHAWPTISQRPPPIPPPPPPPPSPPPPPPVQPVDLFLPSIEKDKYLSEAAYTLYTRFIDELNDFVEIQRSVMIARLGVQQKRLELSNLRSDVSRRDAAIMDYMRECIAEGIGLEFTKLLKLFEATQATRDRAGPCEAEYEPLEVELGASEHRLMQKYTKIEDRFESFFNLTDNASSQQSAPPIEYESSSASSNVGDRAMFKAKEDYLYGAVIGKDVPVGQLPFFIGDIAVPSEPPQELQEQRTPKEMMEARKEAFEKRQSQISMERAMPIEEGTFLFGWPMYDENHESPQITASYEENLDRVLEGIEVNPLCKDPEYFCSLREDVAMMSVPQEVEKVLLLGDDLTTQKVLSDYLTVFESSRDRINRWILHQLRLSPRQVGVLARHTLVDLPHSEELGSLAIENWFRDDLGENMIYHTSSAVRDTVEPIHMRPASRPDSNTKFDLLPTSGHRRIQSSTLSNVARASNSSNVNDNTAKSPPDTKTESPPG